MKLESGHRTNYIRFDAATLATAHRMFLSGVTLIKVAEKIGCGDAALSRELRANGYSLKRGNYVDSDMARRIVEMYANGNSIRQIGRTLHRNDRLISESLRASGVHVRGTRGDDSVKPQDDDDAPPVPPRWAVAAYCQRISGGMPEHVARKVSHLERFDWSQVTAVMAQIPEAM